MQKQLFFGFLLFVFGWLCSSVYSGASSMEPIPLQEEVPFLTVQEDETGIYETAVQGFEKLQNSFAQERNQQSPQDWISMEQIHVYNNRVVIDVKDPEWSIFTDTKSMDPVIDGTSNAIEVIPKNVKDISVGDIVAYESEYADGIITHRIIEISEDEEGWYAKLKGDNNQRADPGKIRFHQIKRVVVAIIY